MCAPEKRSGSDFSLATESGLLLRRAERGWAGELALALVA
jgi:hypothetical protein